MKRHSEIKERQNDETALTLLRASERCYNHERYIKYLMIFLSFSVCLAAIFNRYLPQMFPAQENIVDVQAKIATYVNLISGVVLVCGIVLGFYVSRMHKEGTALQDRYEAHVFNNSPNLTILRPVPETMVEIYAKKTRRRSDEKYKNAIYGPDDYPSDATAQFEYIKKEARFDYKLNIYIQPFFLTIWIGFCILVMIIAVSFNDRFITTLINILIPSLSAISIIANSWHSSRQQIRQLQNLLNVIDDIQTMPENKRMLYITDKKNIRLLADGLFEYRVSPFLIPKFLIRKFQKSSKSMYNNAVAPTETVEETARGQSVTDKNQAAAEKDTKKTSAVTAEKVGNTAKSAKKKGRNKSAPADVNTPKTKTKEATQEKA